MPKEPVECDARTRYVATCRTDRVASQDPPEPYDPNTVLVDPNKISGIYVFQLPSLSENQMITSADLSLYCNGPGGITLDVYGIRHSTSPAILETDYWAEIYDPNAHLFEEAIVSNTTSASRYRFYKDHYRGFQYQKLAK